MVEFDFSRVLQSDGNLKIKTFSKLDYEQSPIFPFTRTRVLLALLSLRKNGGLLVVYLKIDIICLDDSFKYRIMVIKTNENFIPFSNSVTFRKPRGTDLVTASELIPGFCRSKSNVPTPGSLRTIKSPTAGIVPGIKSPPQNKMADIKLDRQGDYPANLSHYPVVFIYCKQQRWKKLFFLMFVFCFVQFFHRKQIKYLCENFVTW